MDPNQNFNNDPNQNPAPQVPEPVVPTAQDQPAQAPQAAAETEPPTVQESLQQQPQATPGTAAAPAENPGQTLGIISIVLSLIGFSLIGLIVGVISRKKSKAAGQSTTLGTVGMVLGIIFTVLGFLLFVLFALTAFAGIQQATDASQNSSIDESSQSVEFDSSFQE